MKKYYTEISNDQFPVCTLCGDMDCFYGLFGIVNDKIYCISCIEKNQLKDDKIIAESIASEKLRTDLKPYISKHYHLVNAKYKFRTFNLDNYDRDWQDYDYYKRLAVDEFIHILALNEFQKFKNNTTTHWLDPIIKEYEEFIIKLTKVRVSDMQEYYNYYKPNYDKKNRI
jgi:hypothetical protein